MKTVSMCLFGGALLGAGLSNPATADITINDEIDVLVSFVGNDYGSYAYNYGALEIDSFDFTVLSDSYVTLDVLTWQVFDTYFDSKLYLFNNDGNPLSYANYVDANVEYVGVDTNGSVNSIDSFLNIFLTAGDYTVSVGAFNYGVADAEAGFSSSGVVFGIGGFIPQSGEYQLDIIGDVVPAPGALALLGLGGVVGARRRR